MNGIQMFRIQGQGKGSRLRSLVPFRKFIPPVALVLLALGQSGSAQPLPFGERFGVIDIIPVGQSAEAHQNSEPSIAVGTGSRHGKYVVHAFSADLDNAYYTSAGDIYTWTQPWDMVDYDATMDWSSGGTAYAATVPIPGQLFVFKSSDPTTTDWFPITSSSITGFPDQPWVRVRNVGGTDHVYVGFNDVNQSFITCDNPHLNPCPCGHIVLTGTESGRTASVRFSLDGGTVWNTTDIEKVRAGGGQDSPAVRLAISGDGANVYALFQRWTSWNGAVVCSDVTGDVVLTRDDNSGRSNFGALPSPLFPNSNTGGAGTVVAGGITLPWRTMSGAQRLGSHCDLEIDPTDPRKVYVAYTEVLTVGGPFGSGFSYPVIRVQSSTDGGNTFTLRYTTSVNAAGPALAVTTDGTVGMLFLAAVGSNLEVHFIKFLTGDFSRPSERILARFPNNNPVARGQPYLGDYFQLRAVGYNFFGTFCASGNPLPANFPSGVYFQRRVNVGGVMRNNFWLTAPGTLVDVNNNPVNPSIDPFFFYDIAPLWYFPYVCVPCHYVYWRLPWMPIDPGDPFSGTYHIAWPALAGTNPPIQLQASASIVSPNWTTVQNVIQTNGMYEAAIDWSQKQQFFRLSQDVGGARFQVLAAADANGQISPNGVLSLAGTKSQTFTATATNIDYGIISWYVDGEVAASNISTLTLSNITADHSVLAMFAPSNDIAVSISSSPTLQNVALLNNDLSYEIRVVNVGSSKALGVTMTNPLPVSVAFVSATNSQGSVNYSGGQVTAALGNLDPGAVALVRIDVIPTSIGSITDTVSVATTLFEPNLANNTATEVTTVAVPLTITNQPVSQTTTNGGSATFTVGASGLPTVPFSYQWFYNGSPIAGATSDTLKLSPVTPSQAGDYSAAVFQVFSAEDMLEADSDPATLKVQ